MSVLSRRDLLAGATAALPAQSAAQTVYRTPTARRPNILCIMVDEMRWDAMSCQGHPLVETPALDKLAQQGTRFENCYTVSPVCCPARACFFSSRYAHVNGVESNGYPARNGEIFLPTILRHHGYHTAISGKLHYTPKQFDYGFDQFWTFTNEGPTPELGYIAYLQKTYGSPAKWPRVEGSCPWPNDELGRDVGVFLHKAADFETEWITDRSLDYLRSRQKEQKPWFLFTSYLKPHSPSVEPQPWFGKYKPSDIPMPALPANAREIRASKRGRQRRAFVDDPEMVRIMSAIYYGSIAHIDNQIARLLAELDRLGMADNTLVMFTADHGNMLGDHGRWFKGVMYEGSARVPMLWRGPKGSRENGGKVVRQAIENTDVMPALLEAAGLPIPEGLQGRSFLKLARSGDPNWKGTVFSQLRDRMWLENGFKYIESGASGQGTPELYDLRNDPREQRNLAADPAHNARLAHARQRIAAVQTATPPALRVPGMSTPLYAHVDEAERRQAIHNAPDNVEAREAGRAPAGATPTRERKPGRKKR